MLLQLVHQRAWPLQEACEITFLHGSDLGLKMDSGNILLHRGSDSGPPITISPGELVISGSLEGIQIACDKMDSRQEQKGSRPYQWEVAFHSPLMELQGKLDSRHTALHSAHPSVRVIKNVSSEAVVGVENNHKN